MVEVSACTLLFSHPSFFLLFFFNDTATTEIYTLSLHDALPIFILLSDDDGRVIEANQRATQAYGYSAEEDRKSTRLNSSHSSISYAVFCLKKKKKNKKNNSTTH